MAAIVIAHNIFISVIRRAALALLVVLGPSGGAPMPVDPARALAVAAGSLCLGDAPAGVPPDGHRHEQCLFCQGSGPAGWVGPGTVVPTPVAMVAGGDGVPVARVWAARRAAYASRAPPGGIG
jgi:hypothetical protein